MKRLIIVLSIIISSNCMADDVYLKNGTIYLNVRIVERADTSITVQVNQMRVELNLTDIYRIVEKEFDTSRTSVIKHTSVSSELKQAPEKNITRPYLPLLTVTALGGLIAWDTLSGLSDIQDSNVKTRKTIVGVGAIVISALSAAISFYEVEVTVTGEAVTFSYRF